MRVARGMAMIGCVALLAAGCGDSDSSSTGATTTTAGSSDDSGSSDGTTDAGAALDLVPGDCQFLLAGAFLNPLAGAVPGSELDLGDSAQRLEAIADKAPDEIKDAMRTLSEGFAAYAQVMKDIDLSDPSAYADPEVQEKLEELESVFDDDFEAAGEVVSDYVDTNCSGD